MKAYDFSFGHSPIGGVSACPELADAIAAGDCISGANLCTATAQFYTYGLVEDIGRHRETGKRDAYVYRLQSCRTPSGRVLWHAYGEYCWAGRTASDADYEFLDGGAYFANRSAALWAIYLWLAHLHRSEVLGQRSISQTLSNGV